MLIKTSLGDQTMRGNSEHYLLQHVISGNRESGFFLYLVFLIYEFPWLLLYSLKFFILDWLQTKFKDPTFLVFFLFCDAFVDYFCWYFLYFLKIFSCFFFSFVFLDVFFYFGTFLVGFVFSVSNFRRCICFCILLWWFDILLFYFIGLLFYFLGGGCLFNFCVYFFVFI